jgi:hypothetical protein
MFQVAVKTQQCICILYICIIQGDQKVSVLLMIIQKVTSNVQRVPRRSAWQPTARARGTLDSH